MAFTVNYCCKPPHLRCLQGYSLRLCLFYTKATGFRQWEANEIAETETSLSPQNFSLETKFEVSQGKSNDNYWNLKNIFVAT